jgi:cyclopropane fatty-acyl-phospholipid synthase-like methyltransferase
MKEPTTMGNGDGISSARGGFLSQTYRASGFVGCARKIIAGIRMNVAPLIMRRRTNRSVGAYFDLVTDDGRMFYGDNFHFGFFHDGATTLCDALDAHTDMVARMARLGGAGRVLDIGCGICAPAIRIAGTYGGHITGINISREQVRQAKLLIDKERLADRIDVREGNALDLDFEDGSFDSLLCLEVAGDICVTEAQKTKFIDEIYRVLKPGGHIGFSDLAFTGCPTADEEKAMKMILYHEGHELITDWPALFKRRGFEIREEHDMIEHTMPTWDHFIAVYEGRRNEVEARYGRRIAAQSVANLKRLPAILRKFGSFPVLSARKPAA